MFRLGRPLIPKEHGLWGTLLIPLVVGSLAAPPDGHFNFSGFILLIVSSLACIFALEPARVLLGSSPDRNFQRLAGWLFIYCTIALGAFSALLFFEKITALGWFLIPAIFLGMLRLWSFAAKRQRTAWVEYAGVFGLVLASPAGWTVQNERFPATGSVVLYVILLIWMLDRTMFVRKALLAMRMNIALETLSSRFSWYKRELLLHIAGLILAGISVILSDGEAPIIAVALLFMATLKNGAILASPSPPKTAKKFGKGELYLALAFGLSMIFCYTAWRHI